MAPLDERALRPEQIRAMLDAGVAAAVRHALASSPFYRAMLLGLAPGDIRGVTDLPDLPITTKRDLAAGRELWAAPLDRVVDIASTSGTTGEPTLYPMTQNDLARLAENERLSFVAAGLTSADTVLLAVTLDRCFMAGLAYFEGLRALGATVARVGSGSPAMLLDMLRRLQPSTVVSVPSFLAHVAAYAAAEGFDLSGSSVRRLVCIGEPVRDEALAPTPLAERIAAAWGAEVLGTYGITELAASACECPAQAGGHLHPSLLHVEILDDSGRPVPPGVLGEVVATPLGVEAFPLLRYRTGDIAALYEEPCACGLCTPRLGPIVGRKHQALKLKGTTVYPAAVQRVLDASPEVRAYVLIARAPSALSDELEILMSIEGSGRSLLPRLRARLQGALKVTPCLRVVPLVEIEALQDAGVGRKKRVFVDERDA
ncbi:MAG: AMP-binding protein [Pseudomonadota bacterium]